MRVTVCEISNDPIQLKEDWKELVKHVRSKRSDLVLLPEMPFYPWIAQTRYVETDTWKDAVSTHELWMERFIDLKPAVVAGTFPVIRSGRWLNEGFVYNYVTGYKPVHHKYYLPNEKGFWEALWYERGENNFSVIHSKKAALGFLICSELWFSKHARLYARQGIQLILTPRATKEDPTDKWLSAGRVAAIVSGAYCLSSNFSPDENNSIPFGGKAWIIEPEVGNVLGVTSPEDPFLTLDIQLDKADRAKRTYPRYIRD